MRFPVSRSNVTDPIDSPAQRLKQNQRLTGNVARQATVYSNRRRQAVPEIRGEALVCVSVHACVRTYVYVCAFALEMVVLRFVALFARRDPALRKYITLDVVLSDVTFRARIYSLPPYSVLRFVAGPRNSLRVAAKETPPDPGKSPVDDTSHRGVRESNLSRRANGEDSLFRSDAVVN